MADHISIPAVGNIRRIDPAWAPLGEPVFRSLWIAAVISYTGTWMQNVGAGWLMTQLTTSPLMVSLVQAAAAIPVFLVVLPAGALADMVDRRRILLFTQSWMVAAAAALGVLTLFGVVTPWVLLVFTFLMGMGAVMNDPAWQAITPDVVSPPRHAAAVALNSAGFNVARAVGPALGGMVVAAAGSGWSFLLNAASFFGVILFLCKWKHAPREPLPTRRVWDATLEGFRYVRGAPQVRSVLIRTGAFSFGATSLLALLPVICQPHGAQGYGFLLTCFGLGALTGAALLPRLRVHYSVDGLVAGATVVFAAMTFLAGQVHFFEWLCLVLFTAGAAWIGILACFNVVAQTMCPSWMRARALSMYLLVLQGGMAVGSAFWGAVAARQGVPAGLAWSALAMIAGLSTIRRHRLTAAELQMAPAVVRD
ncbi:MAG TPA: MFS transporter [Candidatus Dormibacteraeota bacterium]|nr:MFS transporter [Candidatus Dormibacteraeota bacterium]